MPTLHHFLSLTLHFHFHGCLVRFPVGSKFSAGNDLETEILAYQQKSDSDEDEGWFLHPHGGARQKWDMISLIFIIYNAVAVPFMLCFAVDFEPGSSVGVLERAIDVFFIVDLFLNFGTAIEGTVLPLKFATHFCLGHIHDPSFNVFFVPTSIGHNTILTFGNLAFHFLLLFWKMSIFTFVTKNHFGSVSLKSPPPFPLPLPLSPVVNGEVVFHHGVIFKDYMSSWFIIDLMSAFPWFLLEGGSGELDSFKLARTFRLFRLFRLLRVLRVSRILHRLEYAVSACMRMVVVHSSGGDGKVGVSTSFHS
jgi:hypothetical protein